MNGLKAAREQCDMTMQEIADKIGVSKQVVSMWEKGEKEIPTARKKQLSGIFGLEESCFGEVSEYEAKSFGYMAFINDKDKVEFECEISSGNMKRRDERMISYIKNASGDDNAYGQFIRVKMMQKEVEKEIHSVISQDNGLSIKKQTMQIEKTVALYRRLNEIVKAMNELSEKDFDSIYKSIVISLHNLTTEISKV